MKTLACIVTIWLALAPVTSIWLPSELSCALFPALGADEFSTRVLISTLSVFLLLIGAALPKPATQRQRVALLIFLAAGGLGLVMVHIDLRSQYVRLISVPSRGRTACVSVGSTRTNFALETYGNIDTVTDEYMLSDRGPWEDQIELLWTRESVAGSRRKLLWTYVGSMICLLLLGLTMTDGPRRQFISDRLKTFVSRPKISAQQRAEPLQEPPDPHRGQGLRQIGGPASVPELTSLASDPVEVQLPFGSEIGPYKIVALLGTGGMGKVYKARDLRLGRMVAIKILMPRFRSHFQREAQAIAMINHPHICTLHDVGPDYLVMELVEGETLSARLLNGPLEPKFFIRYGVELADGIAAAHAKGLIHRDLKPRNIMLTKNGVKILDFGLAKSMPLPSLGVDPSQVSTITVSQRLGTPAYMAPEQLSGEAADARADIFAIGLILYEMATGKRPVRDSGEYQFDNAAMDEKLGEIGIAPHLVRIIQRCVRRNPDERWQSAADLRIELDWIRSLLSKTAE